MKKSQSLKSLKKSNQLIIMINFKVKLYNLKKSQAGFVIFLAYSRHFSLQSIPFTTGCPASY